MFESPKRFKLGRAGRRGGKTRLAATCAITGHGPDRCHVGAAQDGRVAWIVRDYPQADELWIEYLEPRFKGKEDKGIDVNSTKRLIQFPGGGKLQVHTAKNIESVRGFGPNGVIFDEAAYMNLRYAWTKVVRPGLMDCEGWAIFISTTNAGPDGDPTRETPSFFNRLCQQQLDGKLDDDWGQWHWRTRDNPILPASEITKIYEEYAADGPGRDQELDALLITGGAGLAFPEWQDDIHVVPTKNTLPQNWEYYATLDWGYVQGSYALWGIDQDGNCERVWEFYQRFKKLHAREAALAIFHASSFLPPANTLFYDGQMDQDAGVKGGLTLKEEWLGGMVEFHGGNIDQAPVMIPTTKGPGSRHSKKNQMHAYLKWRDIRHPETGKLQPWARPRLVAQARCVDFIRTMRGLPLDVKDPTDVDTDAEDHAYDDACMVLMARPQAAEKGPEPWDQDKSPGFDGRKKRNWQEMGEREQERRYGYGYRSPRSGELEEIEL